MTWYAAGALSNENGGIYYGKAGDQGGEVTRHKLNTSYWYGGKIIIMPSNLQLIAWTASQACINQCFGYDQISRVTGYNLCKNAGWDPRKVKENCAVDCSELVGIALNAAGFDVPSSVYTGNLEYWCKKYGGKVYPYDPDRLRTGAILLKRWTSNGNEYGHTEVCTGETPNPSKYVSKANTIASGNYKVAVNMLNVRSAPGLNGSIVAAYGKGETINLQKQTLVTKDGYNWASYTAYSGKTRYIAFSPVSGSAYLERI